MPQTSIEPGRGPKGWLFVKLCTWLPNVPFLALSHRCSLSCQLLGSHYFYCTTDLTKSAGDCLNSTHANHESESEKFICLILVKSSHSHGTYHFPVSDKNGSHVRSLILTPKCPHLVSKGHQLSTGARRMPL